MAKVRRVAKVRTKAFAQRFVRSILCIQNTLLGHYYESGNPGQQLQRWGDIRCLILASSLTYTRIHPEQSLVLDTLEQLPEVPGCP